MRHLDLFSGIGGFALATEMVWGRDEMSHTFCDNDPFCQAVLKKHWPDAPIYGDIRTLTQDSERLRREHGAAQEQRNLRHQRLSGAGDGLGLRDEPYLLTGGFPCQPFSAAGRRKGTADNRYLWPEMLRVIREFSPRWVIGENVGGLVTWDNGMVLEQVFADLESADYTPQAFVIPAAGLDAPHRRDRVWIVAHSNRRANGGDARCDARSRASQRLSERHAVGLAGQPSEVRDDSNAERGRRRQGDSNAGRARKGESALQERRGLTHSHRDASDSGHYAGRQNAAQRRNAGKERLREERSQANGIARTGTLNVALASSGGLKGRRVSIRQHGPLEAAPHFDGQSEWSEPWIEVATRLCALDDGLPDGLVRPRGWRNAALKAAGNAIVPQVAAEIMRAIKAVDESV